MKYLLIILLSIRAFGNELSSEKINQLTDFAALQTQEISIHKLQSLLKQYRGTPREAELLSRLADFYLQRSGITFRVSEGVKESNGKTKKTLYTQSLKDSIRIYSELILKFPDYPQSIYGRYKRGKAYKELNQIKESKMDYVYLTIHHRDFELIDTVYIDLADFAADANQHQEALTYLKEIEKMKESEYYPFALHKSAWSHFNLGNYAFALEYLKIENKFYSQKKEMTTGDIAFIESIFNDAALFYFEAINKKASFANIEKAVLYFKEIDQKGLFGSSLFKLAKLLKAYQLNSELDQLKDLLIQDYIQLPEATEVSLLIFQYQFEKMEYSHLDSILKDLKKIKTAQQKSNFDKKIENSLIPSLVELNKQVVKNKLSTQLATLSNPLINLTEKTSELLGKENSISLQARYTLAETLFEIKNFTKSTQTYFELLSPEYTEILRAKKITLTHLALRMISSRYQELIQNGLISKNLEIRNINQAPIPLSRENIKLVQEWISWLDQYQPLKTQETNQSDQASWVAFNFEANKLIYEHFDINESIKRFELFSNQNTKNELSLVAMSIILDTYSKSENWNALSELSKRILSSKIFKDPKFNDKIYELGAQAHFKLTLEMNQDNSPEQLELVKRKAQECIQQFERSQVINECKLIVAKIELKNGNYQNAEHELNSLLSSAKENSKIESILLMLADTHHKMGKFSEASSNLLYYQKITHFKDPLITQNLLEHYWFKRDFKSLNEIIHITEACTGKSHNLCELYQIAQNLVNPSKIKISYATLFKNAIHTPKSIAVIWTLMALAEPKRVPFNDRLVLLQKLSQSWDELNPIFQIHLLPLLQSRIEESLTSIQTSSHQIAPLSIDPHSIEKRITLTREIDLTLSKTMKLPFISIKLNCANQLFSLYSLLIQDLRKIQTPEDLLKPFLVKNEEITSVIQSLKIQVKNYVIPPADKNSEIQKTAFTDSFNARDILISDEMKNQIPTLMWNEWQNAVNESKSDYLFFLIGQIENSKESLQIISPVMKGLILLLSQAPTEAYELIFNAPASNLRTQVLAHFETKGAT